MRSLLGKVILLVVCLCAPSFLASAQQIPSLGSAYHFNALADKKVTSTGSTLVNANLGVANGTIAGFPPGISLRNPDVNNSAAKQALLDAKQAFNNAFALSSELIESNRNLGSLNYAPGVYKIGGDAVFSGNVTLHDGGKSKPTYIFQIPGDLTVSNNAVLDYTNKVATNNILWLIDGDLIVGKNAILEGTFIAKGKVTLNEGARLQGRIISLENEIFLSQAILNTPSDLMIDITMSASSTGTGSYEHNEEVTFYFKVTNKGPADENEAYVRTIAFIGDLLSYTTSRDGTVFNPETGEWKIGKIAYNESITLTLKVKLSKSGFGYARAVVEGDNIDEDLLNNSTIINYCVLLSETSNIDGPTEICRDGTYIYSILPVAGASKFIWSVPPGWQYTQLSSTSISVKPGIQAGQITVKASNICGEGPARILEVALLPDPPVKPGSISGENAVCVGSEGLKYKINPVENATSYTWTLPEGWSITSGQGTTEVTVKAGPISGSVSVAATNRCGASQAQTFQVDVTTEVPTINVSIRGIDNSCVGSNATFEIDATPGATGYIWEVPADWIIKSGQNTNSITVTVGKTAGSITVKASNACGLSTAQTMMVTPTFSPTDAPGPITGNLNSCANEKGLVYSIEPVPGAASYNWTFPAGWVITAGQGTTSITVNASTSGGYITVTAINQCGPSLPSSRAVQPTQSVPAMPGAISGKQYGCARSTAVYTIAEVTDATNYTWTVPTGWSIVSGQGTTSITVTVGTEKGKVTVNGSNICGASATRELEVTPLTDVPGPITTLTGPAEVCQSVPGFEYSVTPMAGVIDYNWMVPAGWVINTGQGTNKISVTPGGIEGKVAVRATNDCGVSAEASMDVKVVPSPPDKPEAISGFVSVCNNQKNLVYTIAPVTGASSYRWTINNGWTIISGQGTTSIIVNASSVGATISVQAVNICGITSETQLTTIVTTTPPAKPGAITGTTIPCIGKEYTFSIADVPTALSYTWSVPAGWQIISQNGTSIKVVAGTTPGNITVTATNNCGTGEAQTLAVNPTSEGPSGFTIVQGGPDVCSNGTATFKVEPGVNVSSYTWAVPAGWSILSGQGTTEITVKANTTAGTVSLTAGNDCSTTTVSKQVSISTTKPNAPGPITSTGAVCAGASSVFNVSPVTGATSYLWEVPAGWVIVSGQGTTNVQIQTGSIAGTIKVYAVNACGNSSNASTLDVAPFQTNLAKPASIKGPAADFCKNQTNLKYSIDPVAGASTYTWTVPTGWTITAGQGTTAITVTSGVAGGEITVAAGNPCGTGTAQSLAVKPNTVPAQPTNIVGSADPCNGATTEYSVTGVAGLGYTWTVPAGWTIVNGQGTNKITVKATSTSGTVNIVATNTCGASTAAQLQVKPVSTVPAAPVAIKGAANACAGRTVTYTVDGVALASSYEWKLPEGWTIVSGQGTAQITVLAGTKPGTITVVSKNGCGSSSQSAALDVNIQILTPPVAILDRSEPCGGLMYEVEPVADAKSYTWTVPAGWTITSGQGTSKIYVVAGEGSGSITVKVDNGTCTSEPISLTADKERASSDLGFPNVFSPNNDGNNDTWVVKNLEKYSDNDLTIINRWGNEVYKARSYKNNWTGDGLSEGTYYYIVRVTLCDGRDHMFKGYVMIVR
ncbi:gliding motility-associated-like protein [Pontibacter aydingkolensis]|uniref:Ice-binding family protein n=1 Tax=Pontibacter aydingkolensis TaxID=1911536 RepID=A0ABS7CTB2_9BACT|nr:ice-binding family protein [Pontibacter aydingkolensis]MBW7467072.1 ice-binding family protein [Pontibacter aydingkolensis]